MAGDPIKLDLSWLPATGWATKGRAVPGAMEANSARLARARSGQDFTGVQRAGIITAIAGGLMSAVGTFYEVQAIKDEAKSAASSLEFQASLASINARSAEQEAQSILQSGQAEVGRLTMQAGADKASRATTMASRGIRLGVGSAAEVQASGDIIKELDVLTINANATRAASAARTGRTNYQNQSLINRASARNARRSGRTANPYLGAVGSFLSSAASFGSEWATDRRFGAR